MQGIYRSSAVVLIFVLLFSMVSCDFGSLGGGGLVGELLGSAQDIWDPDDQGNGSDEYLTDIEQTFGPSEEEPTQDVTVEVDHWVSPYLPDVDLMGTEINILLDYADDVGLEEASSDPLEDAIYRRNIMIEEQYGVELNWHIEQDYIQARERIKNDFSNGAGEYHFAFHHMVDSTANLALSGCLVNLLNVDYVDFSQAWWDQDNLNGFRVGDQMLMASGDLLPSTTLLSSAIFFNKNLFDERSWEYPYSDAASGSWTLDDMLMLTEDQAMDLNGDGKMNYAEDFYGFVAWSLDCDYGLAGGAGMTMFEYDGDHLPVYNANTDKLQSIYDKIYSLVASRDTFHVTIDDYLLNDDMPQEPCNVFASGRALFFASYLRETENLRFKMEDDYGILPMPKYDEAQEQYRTFINGSASVLIIPKSVNDEQLDVAGYMIEVLASSSYYNVTKTALYQKLEKSRTLQDSEMARMVDLIIRHKVFDFGYTHFYMDSMACATVVQTSLNSDSPSIIKSITKDELRTLKTLKKIYETYGYDY